MCNSLANYLNSWATSQGGVALVVEDVNEKIEIGSNNLIGPRCLIAFSSEEPYGEMPEQTGYVKRSFLVSVERGKAMTQPRNSTLTNTVGPIRPFYNQVEEARDIIRAIALPPWVAYNPVLYDGMVPGHQTEYLIDQYVLSFSIICQISRIQYQPPEITGAGPFVRLEGNQWPSNSQPNVQI